MSSSCPICSGMMEPVVLNTLPYERCSTCRFLAAKAGADLEHYAHKEAGLSPAKVAARERNSMGRIHAAASFADLNNLCDIGAGEGSMLAALYSAGYRNLVGIEPAAYVDTLSHDERYELVRGTLEDLPKVMASRALKNASMFHVIEHLPDAPAALRAIFETMPRGGNLFIETPDSDSYMLRHSGYKHDLIYPEHVSLFNASNLKRALEEVGFKVIAAGRRDFDPPLSIKESLVRLGLRPYREGRNRMHMSKAIEGAGPAIQPPGRVRTFMRWALYALVVLLSRQDYFWLVARKP